MWKPWYAGSFVLNLEAANARNKLSSNVAEKALSGQTELINNISDANGIPINFDTVM